MRVQQSEVKEEESSSKSHAASGHFFCISFTIFQYPAFSVCMCFSCISYTVTVETQCYIRLFSINMSSCLLYPGCVYFLFKVHFSFKKKKKVASSIKMESWHSLKLWSLVLQTVPPRLDKWWWWCYLEHSKESRHQSALVYKSRESSISPSQPCKDREAKEVKYKVKAIQ